MYTAIIFFFALLFTMATIDAFIEQIKDKLYGKQLVIGIIRTVCALLWTILFYEMH
jgi:hypothetical protein